jgi:hypothetical protein
MNLKFGKWRSTAFVVITGVLLLSCRESAAPGNPTMQGASRDIATFIEREVDLSYTILYDVRIEGGLPGQLRRTRTAEGIRWDEAYIVDEDYIAGSSTLVGVGSCGWSVPASASESQNTIEVSCYDPGTAWSDVVDGAMLAFTFREVDSEDDNSCFETLGAEQLFCFSEEGYPVRFRTTFLGSGYSGELVDVEPAAELGSPAVPGGFDVRFLPRKLPRSEVVLPRLPILESW